MNQDISKYHKSLLSSEREVCEFLYKEICEVLKEAENKVWHAHPVWFLDGNPVVGYSKQKAGIRLMFWSGKSFDEEKLQLGTGRFQDASVFYTSARDINPEDLYRWLKKSREIQWDYKHIVKKRGVLERLK